jgi:hypothetical protein
VAAAVTDVCSLLSTPKEVVFELVGTYLSSFRKGAVGWFRLVSSRAFVLLDTVATVNDDQLAGDIGSGFRSEKRDSRSDFVRPSSAAHRSISTSDDFVPG